MEPVASGKKPLSPAKKKWIILAAVAAALVLFALWYTRPIPFQELIPGAKLGGGGGPAGLHQPQCPVSGDNGGGGRDRLSRVGA